MIEVRNGILHCTILIIDGDPALGYYILETLSGSGLIPPGGGAVCPSLAIDQHQDPQIVLINVTLSDDAALARIWRRHNAARRPRMIVYAAAPDQHLEARAKAIGADGAIADVRSPTMLLEAVSRWFPINTAAIEQMAQVFGAPKLAELLASFGEELTEGMRELDGPDRTARAHRLGGLAGTLGLDALSRALIALSEGHDSALPIVRGLVQASLRRIKLFQQNAQGD